MMMTDRLLSGWMLLTVGLLYLVLSGCASTPAARFYTVSALPASGEVKDQGREPCVSIGIGPVRIPSYLDQSGIVTQASPNEYRVEEFSRWSEPLENNISRTLATNLTALLCTKMVAAFPWRNSITFDYRLFVDVTRMDGVLGESAILNASWMIFDGADKRKLLAAKQTICREGLTDKSYESFVAAQSRNIGVLSNEIAAAIKILLR
jgi:uncharacterized lipoprotein YmbA